MTSNAVAPPPSILQQLPLTIFDPRDGSLVGEIDATPPELLSDIIARSRRAARSWARISPEERGRLLRDAARRVSEREEELARLNERETGKLYADALGGVRAGVDTLLQYAELVRCTGVGAFAAGSAPSTMRRRNLAALSPPSPRGTTPSRSPLASSVPPS
jgi:acyl-CoA reductase-like NAD-dependent aldehyde dehydrogenase